jgi:hypothetical protein
MNGLNYNAFKVTEFIWAHQAGFIGADNTGLNNAGNNQAYSLHLKIFIDLKLEWLGDGFLNGNLIQPFQPPDEICKQFNPHFSNT